MVKLSVNVNKAAVLRNSRGGSEPCLIQIVKDLIQWGAWGITVHPRPDGRHILYQDVRDIAQCVQKTPSVEFNVEGYPSEKFLNLIAETGPHQCTLVPDPPEVLTSDQGWSLEESFVFLEKTLSFLKKHKVRSSLFIDPLCLSLDALQKLKPDRVEFYTGHWARAFDCSSQKTSAPLNDAAYQPVSGFGRLGSSQKTSTPLNDTVRLTLNEECLKILQVYKEASESIVRMGIGINAGHDLNQKNLRILLEGVPLIQEVSIGHAFICESLYEGFKVTLEKYRLILRSLSF